MATTLVDPELARALTNALARLRMARELNPRHEVLPGTRHTACDVCTSERRLDRLCDRIPR